MLNLFNMPQLTDVGAKELGKELGKSLARASENLTKIVPSQTTTLVVGGGLFLLCSGWLALAFYKESRRAGTCATV